MAHLYSQGPNLKILYLVRTSKFEILRSRNFFCPFFLLISFFMSIERKIRHVLKILVALIWYLHSFSQLTQSFRGRKNKLEGRTLATPGLYIPQVAFSHPRSPSGVGWPPPPWPRRQPSLRGSRSKNKHTILGWGTFYLFIANFFATQIIGGPVASKSLWSFCE